MIALRSALSPPAFAEEIHKRDFIVTWGMVARGAFVRELNATEIAASSSFCGHRRSSRAPSLPAR